VVPSSANFVFASPPDRDGKRMYDLFYGERILVRHFSDPLLSHGVRISIGTREEMERLLAVLDTHRWF
jgi:histidinol-phosphate aminotransferase